MKKVKFFAALFFMTLSLATQSDDQPIDIDKNTQEMAEAHGYPCENYTVTTKDGYILRLFRILGHRNEPLEEAKRHRRQPVILQHGLLDSSDLYVLNEDPALAYMLADADFDVWLPNFRGNKYSKMHQTLDIKDKEYWNFSVDELIKYDIKAIFVRILEVTRFEQVFYAGHSMGGGTFLAAAARDPAFFGKYTKGYVGLAPSTRSLNSVYLLRLAHYTQVLNTLEALGIHEILNLSENIKDLFSAFCDVFPDVCSKIIKLLADKHPEYDNEAKYGVFFNHYPSGTSTHLLIHMIQQSTRYGYYQYQRNSNDPLIEYDFTKFPAEIPVAIYAGASDLLVSVMDTRWLKRKLDIVGVVKEYKEVEGYGHLTFILPGKYYDPYYDTVKFFTRYK